LFLAAGRFSLKESLPLARPGARDIAGGLAIGLGLWLPAILAANLGAEEGGADFEGVGNEILRSISETRERLGLAGVILLFSVLPALVEELFFRGVILPALLRQYPRATAIWGTALLFGVFHLNLPQGFATIAIGAILGYAVARTGSLWVGVVAHAAHNAAVLLGALLAAEGQAGLLFYATPVAATLLLVGTRLLPKRGRADVLDVF
jgi:membrane protease YdiL (CAAX protease family)